MKMDQAKNFVLCVETVSKCMQFLFTAILYIQLEDIHDTHKAGRAGLYWTGCMSPVRFQTGPGRRQVENLLS